MTSFNIEQKRVDVFASAAPDRPVIYLNTYGREGKPHTFEKARLYVLFAGRPGMPYPEQVPEMCPAEHRDH